MRPCSGDRRAALAHHAGDLGDHDRRDRGSGEREAARSARVERRAERVGHAVVHEHRGHAFERAARRRARAALRPTSARSARGRWRARATTSTSAASCTDACAREHDHERERDRERGAQRRPELDQLAGRDRAADARRAAPRACPDGRSRCPTATTAPPARRTSTRTQRLTTSAACSSGIEVPEAGRTGAGLGRCDRPLVVVDLVPGAVVLAATLDRRDQGVDALGVELRAGAVAQLVERSLLAERPAVRTGRRHGVEGVGDVDDRRLDQPGAVDGRGRGLGGRVAGDGSEEVDAAEQLDRHRLRGACTRSNSASVRRPGLLRSWFGTTSLPMSCISAA